MKHRLLALLALALAFTCAQAAEQPLDRIVAVVNDQVVLSSELGDAIADIESQLRTQGTAPPPPEVLQKQVLERLILTKLQTQRAHQLGLQVSDDEINKALESIAERNSLSMDGLLQAMREEGMDYTQYRSTLREEILGAKLRQREIENRISVSEQDIDLFVETQTGRTSSPKAYRLRHILLDFPSGADEAGRKKRREEGNTLLSQLRKGADFAELAIAHSDGQQALEGGELGWIEGDLLPTAFAPVVPLLKAGEISDLIESDSGLHIVKLEQVRDASEKSEGQELHLRHILIRNNGKRPEAAATLARTLRERLAKGEDFAALATQYSEDPGSKEKAGDLGWQSPDAFEPGFRDNVAGLADGKISEPFETPYGWHIAQLLGRRPVAPDNEAGSLRQRARATLYQRRILEEQEIWLRRLRDEAYVEIRLPSMDGAGAITSEPTS